VARYALPSRGLSPLKVLPAFPGARGVRLCYKKSAHLINSVVRLFGYQTVSSGNSCGHRTQQLTQTFYIDDRRHTLIVLQQLTQLLGIICERLY